MASRKYDHIDFVPPKGVRDEAANGLEWRREYNRGGTEVGVARARDLSNGKQISPDTAKRMSSYFARHEVDKQGKGWSPGEDGFPSAGRIAWALWGGDAGKAWSSKLVKQIDAADNPQARVQVKEIRIDGVIGQGEGQVSAESVRQQLPTNSEPIRVSIHSEGGSVFEGFAIYDLFANYKGQKTIAVESTAFSIASFIAMAFDDIEMSPNGYLMLHNPRVGIEGDDEELTASAEMIGKLKATMIEAYANRSGKTEDEVKAILKAETYMNANEAIANGFASRITGKPVQARPFAQLDTMPHGVVTALFGAGFGGDNRETTKEKSMSDSQPVAATIAEIKAAFPRAKAEFVLNCIEQRLPMASIASVAVKEMMADYDQMIAKVSALEEELASVKAKAMEEEEEKAKAMKEEESAKATARQTGVRPIAQSSTSATPSATAQWNSAVNDALSSVGGNRAKAVALANRQNPGLREAYLAEVNAR